MNVERVSRLLPACGDRWLSCIVAEAFTVEHPVPHELECLLMSLEARRPHVPRSDRSPEAQAS